jgi:hypothetical protein
MELDREFPGAKDKKVSQFVDAPVTKTIDQSGFIDTVALGRSVIRTKAK